MRLGIMQPYFLPYLGYWQLLNAVDIFVIYDNIEFSKRGWFHRNNILLNGQPKMFSIPLKKDSDSLHVRERYLATESQKDISKILGQIRSAYSKAPLFSAVYPLVEECFNYSSTNLFDYINHSIRKVCNYLDISTSLVVSSQLAIDHDLKAQNKVLAICKDLQATEYVNVISGESLYQKEEFARFGILLKFIKMQEIGYTQFSNEFVPNLSIIDVMMFNQISEIQDLLAKYSLK